MVFIVGNLLLHASNASLLRNSMQPLHFFALSAFNERCLESFVGAMLCWLLVVGLLNVNAEGDASLSIVNGSLVVTAPAGGSVLLSSTVC